MPPFFIGTLLYSPLPQPQRQQSVLRRLRHDVRCWARLGARCSLRRDIMTKARLGLVELPAVSPGAM